MIDPTVLHAILRRNEGQILTPELILGLMQGAAYVPERYIDLDQFGQREFGAFTFQVERMEKVASELHPLHEAHWQETEKHRHGLALDYAYGALALADRQGRFLQFTVRRSGELVGYSGMNIHVSTHTKTLVATEDSLFLRPDCRGGRTIFKFIDFIDESLTLLGVKEVRLSTKMVNSTDKLLMKCGFKPFATQLVKFLGVQDEAQTSL